MVRTQVHFDAKIVVKIVQFIIESDNSYKTSDGKVFNDQSSFFIYFNEKQFNNMLQEKYL